MSERTSGIEYADNYIDKHHEELRALLNIGEELGLFHTPASHIRASSSLSSIEGHQRFIEGVATDELGRGGAEAQVGEELTLANLIKVAGLVRRSFTNLCIQEALSHPSISGSAEVTPESRVILDSIHSEALHQFENAASSASSYIFYDSESDKTIEIYFANISTDAGSSLVRSLQIEISDDYITSELKITEFPTSFDGSAALTTEHTIKPLNDEASYQIGELFEQNGTLEGINVLIELRDYYSTPPDFRALSFSSDRFDDLTARYEAKGKKRELDSALAKFIEKLENASISQAFTNKNPEMKLPSDEELAGYTELMSSLRS